jgi:hypothetical protein
MAAVIKKDMDAFEAAKQKASQAVLAAFDRELEALSNAKGKPEDRVKMIETVKAERAAFEQKGRIPFSAPMRLAAKNYLDAGAANRRRLSQAFDFHLKQMNTEKAREYTVKKQQALRPPVVAIWNHVLPRRGARARPKTRWLSHRVRRGRAAQGRSLNGLGQLSAASARSDSRQAHSPAAESARDTGSHPSQREK